MKVIDRVIRRFCLGMRLLDAVFRRMDGGLGGVFIREDEISGRSREEVRV